MQNSTWIPTWRASDWLWSVKDHTLGNKSPKKFWCGPVDYPQEVQLCVTEHLLRPKVSRDMRGWVGGREWRKERMSSCSFSPLSRAKGCPMYFTMATVLFCGSAVPHERRILSFPRPFPISSPLYVGNLSLLSCCPLLASLLLSLACRPQSWRTACLSPLPSPLGPHC